MMQKKSRQIKGGAMRALEHRTRVGNVDSKAVHWGHDTGSIAGHWGERANHSVAIVLDCQTHPYAHLKILKLTQHVLLTFSIMNQLKNLNSRVKKVKKYNH